MKKPICTGSVVMIDAEIGMIRAKIHGMDGCTTELIPYISNSEYLMPNVDDIVLLVGLSNSSSKYIAIGTFWSEKNRPKERGLNIYRKDFGENGCMKYYDSSGTLILSAPKIRLETEKGTEEF